LDQEEERMGKRSILVLLALFVSCSAKDRAVAAIVPAPEAKPAAERKIIRSGELMLQVDSLVRARRDVEAAAAAVGGYVSNSQADDTSASFVLRVPAAQLEQVARGVAHAGHVLRESISAEEITEQYYDVAARLENARRLESRLLDLVAQRTTKMSDVLDVERELARVRGEIEQLEGRRRLWDHQIELATLTVHLNTEAPPEVVATASSTLRGSWRALSSTAHGVFLGGVALLPWSPLLGLMIFGVIRWRRRPTALPQ
jgi:hypothetical protein